MGGGLPSEKKKKRKVIKHVIIEMDLNAEMDENNCKTFIFYFFSAAQDHSEFQTACNSHGNEQHQHEGTRLNVTTTWEAKGQTHAQRFHFLTTKRC